MTGKTECIHHIIYDVLRALTRGLFRKTNLCLTVNLPLDGCSALLSLVESQGLIYKASSSNNLFMITNTGYIYIGVYGELMKLTTESLALQGLGEVSPSVS
ncbi:MAG: winged helix-turn-helix domain-containing protein [Fervidicoccaceae archaeon]|jgi:predicted transcriptional regulator